MAERLRSIVITGASTGIGRTCALHLDRRGFRVFAGVRKEADGEALRKDASERLTPLRLEVTDAASIAEAARTVEAAVGAAPLDGLVNNAGINVGGVMELIPLELLRQQFEVNVFGAVAVTQAFLPLLRRAGGWGRIVNISSAAASMSTPFGGPYAASKIALEFLTQALRRELRGSGLYASVVRPGATESAIWSKSATDSKRWNLSAEGRGRYEQKLQRYDEAAVKLKGRLVPPDKVVAAVEHGLTAARPKPTYLVGSEAWAGHFASQLISERLADYVIGRMI